MSSTPRRPVPLSRAAQERLELLFAGADRSEAARLLVQECGTNLPFCEDCSADDLDRIRFAALKVSGGSLQELRRAVDLAMQDWRDLLVEAGFGHDVSAHLRWTPAI